MTESHKPAINSTTADTRQKRWIRWIVIFQICQFPIGLAMLYFLHKYSALQDSVSNPNAVIEVSGQPADMERANLQLVCAQESFSSAVACVRPAVVNIKVTGVRSEAQGAVAVFTAGNDPLSPTEMFFAGDSIGSGVIVDPRGYVITNQHVIAKGGDIKVSVFGYARKEYYARIVVADEAADLAILKIDSTWTFPTAPLGDSDTVEVGDIVLAIGSPYGFEQSVTLGIVSDNKRTLVIDGRRYPDVIQTDAVINKGNSGGPMINATGEVVGINSAIYAPTGSFVGLGFAIPINRAKRLLTKAVYGN